MVGHTVYFTGMMVFTLTSQMYHRISVLVPVLVRVPEYLSTSTSTSTMTFELTSTSTLRVPEFQYSSTASTSTEYEYPSPGQLMQAPWCLVLAMDGYSPVVLQITVMIELGLVQGKIPKCLAGYPHHWSSNANHGFLHFHVEITLIHLMWYVIQGHEDEKRFSNIRKAGFIFHAFIYTRTCSYMATVGISVYTFVANCAQRMRVHTLTFACLRAGQGDTLTVVVKVQTCWTFKASADQRWHSSQSRKRSKVIEGQHVAYVDVYRLCRLPAHTCVWSINPA